MMPHRSEHSDPDNKMTTLTIRVLVRRKKDWIRRAKRADMSLTKYVCSVMDRAEIGVHVHPIRSRAARVARAARAGRRAR